MLSTGVDRLISQGQGTQMSLQCLLQTSRWKWDVNGETLPPSAFNRSLLLAELEKEEKEKDWYYAQLQNLTKRIDSLPLTENVSTF